MLVERDSDLGRFRIKSHDQETVVRVADVQQDEGQLAPNIRVLLIEGVYDYCFRALTPLERNTRGSRVLTTPCCGESVPYALPAAPCVHSCALLGIQRGLTRQSLYFFPLQHLFASLFIFCVIASEVNESCDNRSEAIRNLSQESF